MRQDDTARRMISVDWLIAGPICSLCLRVANDESPAVWVANLQAAGAGDAKRGGACELVPSSRQMLSLRLQDFTVVQRADIGRLTHLQVLNHWFALSSVFELSFFHDVCL